MKNPHVELIAAGVTAAGQKTVTAPFDQQPIATVETVDRIGVERVLATAHDIFSDRDRWLAPARRREILEQTAQLMEARFEDLALGAAREGGKPLTDSRVEVARAIDGVKNCAELLRENAGAEIPMNFNAASANRLAMTRREPIGVVVALSAFNHPLNLIVHQIVPAIAAGCPAIVKPATDTPLSCFAFVNLLREAGLPDGYAQAINTTDNDVAGQLAADERVGFLSFIGSAAVGWMLRSRLAAGARCALEHGGAAPVIVAPDADLDDCAPLLAKAGLYHAGQVCVSVQRVFAHESIAMQLAERLAGLADKMRIGDPTHEDTDVGPLIRPREVERVGQWVDEAVTGGARLLSGGKATGETTYACTILYDPPADAQVSTREIFGPVVCVYPYSDLDEALARANGLPFAFQSAVFTRDIDTAMRCYRRLNASAVMINDHTAFRVDWMPFAGLRHSGYGVGGIRYTFEDMQIEKMMVLRSMEL
ncbi:MAG: aldehyde dehydrogenase family protein [Gammaproteobacteria bacterium]|nr:aldehyde dehydrogenase family protein [Gammaproteobacteria bacterium]